MFLFYILLLISIDVFLGFWTFLLWRYFDLKYFSTSEIELLKEQITYLQKENKKVNGSSDFWKE